MYLRVFFLQIIFIKNFFIFVKWKPTEQQEESSRR